MASPWLISDPSTDTVRGQWPVCAVAVASESNAQCHNHSARARGELSAMDYYF